MSAEKQRDGRPYARKATLRGSANALINARPTAVNLRWAVERVMARYEEVGELSEDGDAIADAMRAEADAIVFEATTDHGRLAGFGLEILPNPDDRPVRILTHCNTGPLACGQYGTALGVVQAAHHAGAGGPRLGRRDAAVPPGRPADDLGAGPGRRPPHAAPRRGRRAPDGARRGRRHPGRCGPRRRQRRHGEQGRHLPAGRPGRPPRHPVLRLRADQLGRPRRRRTARRSRSRSAPPTRSSSSAACASRRPAPRSATRPSTSPRPSSSPASSPRRASSGRPFEAGLRDATERAAARWASMPGFHAIRPPVPAEPASVAD